MFFVIMVYKLINNKNYKNMAISVDQNTCIGCGACASICSQVFKMNDAGKCEVISQDGDDCAQNAVDSCPVQAISIS